MLHPESVRRSSLLWRTIFGALLVLVLALSLAPLGPDAPTTGWDKTNHLLAFAALAYAGCLAYPGRAAATLVGLLAYGGLIEMLQSFTSYRSAEWGDLLADALGLVPGWLLARMLHALRQRQTGPGR